MKINFKETRFSVVIPTRNGSCKIKRAMIALLKGTRVPDEIVILDQSDDDATQREVANVQALPGGSIIRYVPTTRSGLCAHRNDAIREATGEFIASIDDDVAVDSQWAERMLSEWVHVWKKEPVLISGRVLPDPEFESEALVKAIRLSEKRTVFKDKPQVSNVMVGAHFGASHEIFEKLEPFPFDERLGAGSRFRCADDGEFAYRVLKAGFPVVYEPSIVVTHYTKRVSGWRVARYNMAIGYGAALAKHVLEGDINMLGEFVKALIIHFGKGVRALLLGKEPEGTARLLACPGLVFGFLGWIYVYGICRQKN